MHESLLKIGKQAEDSNDELHPKLRQLGRYADELTKFFDTVIFTFVETFASLRICTKILYF